jgi:hypothetical protein
MNKTPTLEEIKSAADSGDVVCCFCGEPVPTNEALILTVSRIGVASRQNLWAHLEHLEKAIAPSRIEIAPDALRDPSSQ